MAINQEGKINIRTEHDIVTVRTTVRERAAQIGFGNTDVTRIVTAASELARNVFRFAGTGVMCFKVIQEEGKRGIRLVFEDSGPGIEDIDVAMEEGFTSGGGLGLGLPGTKRLMDSMEIKSKPGVGTTVRVVKWLK